MLPNYGDGAIVSRLWIMGENGRQRSGSDGYGDDEKKRRLIRTVCIIIAVVFALGAVACIVVYAVLRLDVLFIPIAVCAVVAMISFTYARVKS